MTTTDGVSEIEFVNEAPPISDDGAHNKSIAFVNDWSELEEAVVKIDDFHDRYAEWDDDAWRVIRNYVPRLLTQYARLLELSYVLTDLVEKQNELKPASGLYLPDHR